MYKIFTIRATWGRVRLNTWENTETGKVKRKIDNKINKHNERKTEQRDR